MPERRLVVPAAHVKFFSLFSYVTNTWARSKAHATTGRVLWLSSLIVSFLSISVK